MDNLYLLPTCILWVVFALIGDNLSNAAVPCPSLRANCMIDPCAVSRCNAFPRANCVSDYCGGCNANFFVGNTLLSEFECQGGVAPPPPFPGGDYRDRVVPRRPHDGRHIERRPDFRGPPAPQRDGIDGYPSRGINDFRPNRPYVHDRRSPRGSVNDKPTLPDRRRGSYRDEQRPVITDRRRGTYRDEQRPVITDRRRGHYRDDQRPVITDRRRVTPSRYDQRSTNVRRTTGMERNDRTSNARDERRDIPWNQSPRAGYITTMRQVNALRRRYEQQAREWRREARKQSMRSMRSADHHHEDMDMNMPLLKALRRRLLLG